jgi:hypothetical protein
MIRPSCPSSNGQVVEETVEKKFEFTINRKTTQTDIIIPNDSCHPNEHKLLNKQIKHMPNN